MKKIILLLSCIFVMTSMSAQTSFQELTLEKALEQAKVENKYVFIDCYTSWCGPCKMMAGHIPFVTALEDGEIKIYLSDIEIKKITCSGGVLTVSKDMVQVLASTASYSQDV